jgi:hypothetical protein
VGAQIHDWPKENSETRARDGMVGTGHLPYLTYGCVVDVGICSPSLLSSRDKLFATGPVTIRCVGASIDLEAVMIKSRHIDHAELLQLGKTLLLLIKRQEIKLTFSSLAELNRRGAEVEKLVRAS